MENKRSYTFCNWEFQLQDSAEGILCTINHYRRTDFPWNDEVEWGVSGEWKHDTDIAVGSAIANMLNEIDFNFALAYEAVAAAYALLLVKDGTPVEWLARAFIYKGGVWCIYSDDMNPNRPYAVGPRNEYIYNPTAFELKDEAKTALALMWVDARQEGENIAKMFEEYEKTEPIDVVN